MTFNDTNQVYGLYINLNEIEKEAAARPASFFLQKFCPDSFGESIL
jgi:hypothetical protein